MNLTRFAIEHKTLTNFLVSLVFVGGIYSYFQLGQLEDPDFTVKTAVIITPYPGATPKEVELEVTDRIETAIQEMPELRYLTSISRAGLSIIKMEMKEEISADRLPQVWDEMRRKVGDIVPTLPPGVLKPDILDDFSFVFGFVLAVTGDGYTYGSRSGGIYSYFQLGQLEDPDFTVKTAVIITAYPGATPKEVELEVTDRIETAIQEMPELLGRSRWSWISPRA